MKKLNFQYLLLMVFLTIILALGCGKEVPQTQEDTTAPVITLSSPTGDTVTNNNQLEVSGSIDDSTINSVNLIHNGSETSILVTDGEFSKVITLWEEPNAIQIIAVDVAGNEGRSPHIIITLDTIPPSISINSPTEGACINSTTVVIKGASSDKGSGIAAVLVNGVTVSGTKNWTVTFSEGSGRHTYEAVALDKAGNQTVAAETVEIIVDIVVDSIYILEPAAGSTVNTSIVVVSGMASDSSGIVRIMVSLDGETIEADLSSLPSWTVTFYGVIEGSHSLKARAVDGCGLGNTAELVEVNFLVDQSCPPWWLGIEATSPAVGISYMTVTLTDSNDNGVPGEQLNITVSSSRNTIITEEDISVDDFEGCATFADCGWAQVTTTNNEFLDDVLLPNPLDPASLVSARFRFVGKVWKVIDTSDYRNIKVSYQATTSGLSAGESFNMWFSTDGGSIWTLVTNSTLTGDTPWSSEEFNISGIDVGVENNPLFAIRFGQNVTITGHFSGLDNIVVSGDPLEDLITFISDNGDGTYSYEVRSCELSGTPDYIGPASICACWDNPIVPPWCAFPCAEVYFVAPSIRITSPSDGATLSSADDSSGLPGFQYTVTATTDAPEGSTVTLTVDGFTPVEAQVDETGMVIFYDADFPEGTGITVGVEVMVCDDVGNDVRVVTVDLSP